MSGSVSPIHSCKRAHGRPRRIHACGRGRLRRIAITRIILAAWRLVSGDAGVSEAVRPSATKAAVVGGGIGLASGVIGLGAVSSYSPALMLGRWAKAKEAAATTALFVWLNSLAGLVGAGVAGRLDLDPSLLFPFVIAVLAGSLIGSRYGSTSSSQKGVEEYL